MIEIDFEALKYADFEVVNVEPTPEELRAFSEFLKERRAKEAMSKKTHSLHTMRKSVRTAAK